MPKSSPYPTPADALAAIVGVLGDARETSPGQWESRCPAHDDRNPSFAASIGDTGAVVLKCQAGCTTQEAVDALSSRLPQGLCMGDLFPPKPADAAAKPRGKIVETYDYLDADGVLLFQVVRFEPKDFRQRRPDGRGGWVWSIKGLQKVLYRTPQLVAAKRDRPVFVVEGEKDVHAIESIGGLATTMPGGAGKWLKKYTAQLKGRHVVVLPDHDAVDPKTNRSTGAAHADAVAADLHGVAESVRIVHLPVAEKQDAADWVAAGGDWAALSELVRQASEWSPDAAAKPAADAAPLSPEELTKTAEAHKDKQDRIRADIFEKLRVRVYGETENEEVIIWSEARDKECYVKDVSRLSLEKLIQMCGDGAERWVTTNVDSAGGGVYALADVRKAIAYVAGENRIPDGGTCGTGLWVGRDDDGGPDPSRIAIIAGGTSALFEGGNLTEVNSLEIAGLIQNRNRGPQWYDFQGLKAELKRSESVSRRKETVAELSASFNAWAWKNPGNTGRLMTALILSTWVQSAWTWRPHVSITGDTGSGKSAFMNMVKACFGPLAVGSKSATAAGISQAINRSAAVIVLDEMDKNRRRQEVYDKLRGSASGDGDVDLRGTPGGYGRSEKMAHTVWVAGIETGMKEAADRNRFVCRELAPKPPGAAPVPQPDASLISPLQTRLLAVALHSLPEALRVASRMQSEMNDLGINPRTLDVYKSSAAILAVAEGGGLEDACQLASDWIEDSFTEYDDTPDVVTLLGDIYSSVVRCGSRDSATVGELIASVRGTTVNRISDDEGHLGRVGLRVRGPKAEPGRCDNGDTHLFIATRTVGDVLLKRNDQFRKAEIGELLARIPGAEKTRATVAETRVNGVLIPLASIDAATDPDGADPPKPQLQKGSF